MVKVFVNGSFDILHRGHLELLNYAKSLGDNLLVAIDTDKRIQYNKGNDRPVNKLQDRIYFMQLLKPVDQVKYFETDEELINIIKEYSPDIMVKGSDWNGGIIIGEEYCKQVLFFDRVEQYSTTNIIQRVKKDVS